MFSWSETRLNLQNKLLITPPLENDETRKTETNTNLNLTELEQKMAFIWSILKN